MKCVHIMLCSLINGYQHLKKNLLPPQMGTWLATFQKQLLPPQMGTWVPTFQRNLLPPHMGTNMPQVPTSTDGYKGTSNSKEPATSIIHGSIYL